MRKEEKEEGVGGIGWALIPPSIMTAKELSANQKLIWGRINGLKGPNGYCFATNEFLAEAIGVKKATVTNILTDMVESGHLSRVLVYRKGKEEILIEGSNTEEEIKGFKYVERRLIPIEIPYDHSIMRGSSINNEGGTPLIMRGSSINNEDKVVLELEIDSSIREECVKEKTTHTFKIKQSSKRISEADSIIDYIEECALKNGKKLSFLKNKESRRDIIDALNEHEVSDLKSVIEFKCKEWLPEQKTMGWVNPNTLFRKEKRGNNVASAKAWVSSGKVDGNRYYKGMDGNDMYSLCVE